MINAHLQQIWGLIKQNYVILQRKEDLIIYEWVSAYSKTKEFQVGIFPPIFYPSELYEILCI